MKRLSKPIAVSSIPVLALAVALTYPAETTGGGPAGTISITKIHVPQSQKVLPPHFVVSGAYLSGKQVVADLSEPGGGYVQGMPLRQPTLLKGEKVARWLIYFKNVPDIDNKGNKLTYTLTVNDPRDPSKTQQVKALQFGKRSDFHAIRKLGGVLRPLDLTSVVPASGDSGPFCATAFTPYGYLNSPDTQVSSTTVQNDNVANGSPIGTIYTYLDTSSGFWCGEFPDLTQYPGYTEDLMYTFNVSGDSGQPASTVSQPIQLNSTSGCN